MRVKFYFICWVNRQTKNVCVFFFVQINVKAFLVIISDSCGKFIVVFAEEFNVV